MFVLEKEVLSTLIINGSGLPSTLAHTRHNEFGVASFEVERRRVRGVLPLFYVDLMLYFFPIKLCRWKLASRCYIKWTKICANLVKFRCTISFHKLIPRTEDNQSELFHFFLTFIGLALTSQRRYICTCFTV